MTMINVTPRPVNADGGREWAVPVASGETIIIIIK